MTRINAAVMIGLTALTLCGCASQVKREAAEPQKNDRWCQERYPLGMPRGQIIAQFGVPSFSTRSPARRIVARDEFRGVIAQAETETGEKPGTCDAYYTFEPSVLGLADPMGGINYLDHIAYDESDCVVWRCHQFIGD